MRCDAMRYDAMRRDARARATRRCPTTESQYKQDHAVWHLLSALGAVAISMPLPPHAAS